MSSFLRMIWLSTTLRPSYFVAFLIVNFFLMNLLSMYYRNLPFLKTLFLALAIAFFFSGSVFAQTAAAIQTGAGSTAEFHVQDTLSRTNIMLVKNTNSTNSMTSVKVKLKLPQGASYQAGSISSNATEFDISNLNQPIFSINSAIAVASNVALSYGLKYDCNVIAYITGGGAPKDLAQVTYTMSGSTYTQNVNTGTTGYNVRYGSLSIISVTNASATMNVGDTYNQLVTIKNGGLGEVYEARLNLDNSTGISIANITVNGSTTGVSVVGNTVTLTGTALGADKKLTLNETVAVSYDVTVNSCTLAASGRNLVASWGQKGVAAVTCQFSSPYNVGIIIANTLPNITVTGSKKQSACPSTTPYEMTFRVKNIGLGKAYNVICDIPSVSGGNKSTYIVPNSYLISYNGGTTFTSFVPTSTYTGNALVPGSTTITCATGMAKGLTHNIGVMNASQEVVIRFQTLRCDFNVCSQSDSYNEFQTTTTYNNQCGVAQTPFSYKMSATSENTVPIAQDIPASVSNGLIETMSYELGSFPTVDTLTARAYGMFVLTIPAKLKYEANAGDVVMKTSAGVVVSPRVGYPKLVGNQLFIKVDNYNTTLKSKIVLLDIKLKADCALSGSNTGTVGLEVYYERDSNACTNAHIIKRCITAPIIIYCPGCSTQSVSFDYSKINVGRANFGSPDNNLDGKPDASGALDMAKVKLNRFIDGDTISISTTSTVNLSGFAAFDSVFAMHTFTTSSKHNWQPVSAQVKIYDASTATYYTITPTSSVSIVKYKYKWKWAKPAGYAYDNGDSIIVKVKYRQSNFSGDAETAVDGVLNLSVAGRYTSSTTAYSCTPYDWNYAVNGYKPVIGGATTIPSNATSCNGATISGVNFSARINSGYNGSQRFTSEFRPLYKPEKYVVIVPAGWAYRPNSNSWKESYTTQIGTSITTSSILQEPTINAQGELEFDMSALFASGQFPVVSTEGAQYTPTFSLMPTCATTTGNANVSFKIYYRDITDNFQTLKNIATAANHLIVNYTKPTISISTGQPTQTFTGNAVSWDIAIANQNASVSVDNVWFHVKTNAALSNIIVKPVVSGVVGTAITPTANGIYQLGTYNGGTTKTYRIFATPSACNNGTIDIQGGWNCLAYPTDTASYPCQKQRLTLNSQPATTGLDAIYDFLDGSVPGTVDACSPVEFKVILNSTLTGDVSTLKVKIPLPIGLTYVPNNVTYQFPYNATYAGTASSYNPTTISGAGGIDTLLFNVNSLAPSLTNGLSGVYNNATKALEFHFKLVTSCGFVYGDEVNCRVEAISACGSALPTLNRISRPLYVAGLTGTSAFAVQFISTPLTSCVSSGNIMRVILTNTGSATGATDIVEATLSPDLAYIPNSSVDSINFSTIGNPTIVGNKLTWHLPVGIAAGQKIAFSFRVQDAANTCGDGSIIIKSKIETAAVACGGCLISMVTGSGGSSAILRQRPSVSMVANFPAISNQTATTRNLTFNVTVNNIGTSALNTGTNILFAIDNNNDLVYDSGDTYLATTTVSSPIAVGASGNLIVTATNVPNAAKNFVIYNDPTQACLCAVASISIRTFEVSGTIFNDLNGNTNDNDIHTSNGNANTGTNLNGLYAILTDGNGVAKSVTNVNANGTYHFVDVINGNYNVVLSTTTPALGSTQNTATLPNGWMVTGEFTGTGAGSDGTNNGINSQVVVNDVNVIDADFGVRELWNIGGNVFDDGNGMDDATLNGNTISNIDGTSLYINLLDENENVTATTLVTANGSYSFANVVPKNYNLQISVNQGTVGNPAPATLLPSDWVCTGEKLGIGTGCDNSPNGHLGITNPTMTNITNANFAINKRPMPTNLSFTLNFNPSLNTHLHLNGNSGLPSPLVANDYEDGAKGAGNTFVIEDISGLGGNELYYNDVLVTGQIVIQNYNPTNLKVLFKSSTFSSLSFTYNAKDNAGVSSATPATYTINWNMMLPVELTNFAAIRQAENALIAWTTQSEINSNYFVVERSIDGGNMYETIGKVNAAGNSNSETNYTFIDENVGSIALEKVLYRLKMVDIDSRYTYSEVAELILDSKKISFHIYPNPTQDILNVEYQLFNTSRASKIAILNMAGEEVFSQKVEVSADFSAINLPVEVSGFASGVYFIKVTAEGQSVIKQFVKE